MTSILLTLSRAVALAAPALLFAGSAVAQAPDRPKPRQPTPQNVQPREEVKTNADKGGTETDRKVREMDRRLNRTLRSVCIGC